MDLLDLIDPLIGSDSHHGFSTGNCLPICAYPFGMTAWSAQTAEGSWFFDRNHRKLQGIRATHQPSPWIGDYGHFVIAPQSGELMLSPSRRSSAFRLDDATVKPHHLSFEFLRYRTTVRLAPTKRCAHLTFDFPKGQIARIILDPCAGEGEVWVDQKAGTMGGFTQGNSGGCPPNFACYFFAKFSASISGFGTYKEGHQLSGSSPCRGRLAGGFVEFEPVDGPIEMKIATSFISIHQAEINLARELGSASFDETLERAGRVWQASLDSLEIEDADDDAKKLFYTCLYRTMLFPRFWNEEDQTNKVIHFSPYDGQTHEGALVADNGFWDTYRTVYPLLALLQPRRLAEILNAWVTTSKEGGWFPQWASPGYRACMVGTHIDAVIADAVSRGIVNFNIEAAFESLLKHAYEPGDEAGNFGRIGIQDYIELGYVSADRHDSSVSRSLDYAYDDWCIAQVARYLGRDSDADALLERSQNYRKLWDSETGFMRARDKNGDFVAPFDPLTWGDPYVEGGAWQSTWAVPHDVEGLIQLMGGRALFVEKLQSMLSMKPDFHVGSYGFEIHEMTEMACADFGQYAHSNQPVHHVLYLFAAAGRPDLTHHYVGRVLRELYTRSSFPGDEDNGEMSAWYLLSSLGIFPLTPGAGDWILGVSIFDRAVIHLESGNRLEIIRSGPRAEGAKLSKVLLDGNLWTAPTISHTQLIEATRLEFVME